MIELTINQLTILLKNAYIDGKSNNDSPTEYAMNKIMKQFKLPKYKTF